MDSLQFKKEMAECGYDVDNHTSSEQRQVINVARCMWNSQQMRLDNYARSIGHYVEVRDSLGEICANQAR